MTTNLHTYPAYKPSGVEWLGDVPEYWGVQPGRAIFAEINERDKADEQLLSVTIAHGVIRQQALLRDSAQKDSSRLDKSDYKLVRAGDIVYNKMRAWQGAAGVSRYRGIVSPAYIVQRPRPGVDPLYFHRLLRIPAFATEAERWSYGIASDMWSLRPEHFKMIHFPLPPLSEQAAIVRYLDHVDRRIRRYVGAKRKLIALLEEEKQAVINQAVTRGLDPNVRLKPSGVEWLGDVPEHWEVRRLKSLLVEALKYGANEPGAHSDPDLPRYIRITDIREDGTLRNDSFRSLPTEIAEPYLLVEGDILFARSGATVGKTFQYDASWGRAAYAGYLIRARLDKSVMEPDFAAYFTQSQSYRNWILATLIQATIQNVSAERYGNLSIPLPSVAEQASIVEYLHEGTADIDTAIARARRQIALVEEYHTRLTADVVTGKLDVREAAAQLPEEDDDQDSIEEDGLLADGMEGDLSDADASAEELAIESEVAV